MVLERQIFLQKECRYSVQHVLHYPTVPMKVKTPALIGEVNLGCLSIIFRPLAGYGLPPPPKGEFCRPYFA